MHPFLAVAHVVALCALSPAIAVAQGSSAWLVRLGGDTLSLERFTRTKDQVRGELVVRTPRSLHRAYTMDLAPDGTVRHFELITRALGPGPGPAVTRGSIDFAGDTAIVVTPRGDTTVTTRVVIAPGATPFLNGVMGIQDQIAHQARRSGTPRRVDLIGLGSGPPWRATVVAGGGDTLRLLVVTPVGAVPPFTLLADAAGNLLSFNGLGSVFQAEAEKVPAVDLVAAEAAYAARPVGALSTRDTVRATLGAAELWLDYGRPLKRARTIFGNVVTLDSVWRTGANAATQFRTSANLSVSGASVPAGTYSLWTLPTAHGWKLILNRQSGQWGTQYDVAQDLARIDASVTDLSEPVERFTMGIEPRGKEALLWLEWDRTRVTVPFQEAKP